MTSKELKQLSDRGLRPEVVHTYKELCRIRNQFVVGYKGFKIPFLIVIGDPGLSKSYQFENTPGACFINSAASAVGLYVAAYQNRNKPMVLDDVDGLLKDQTVVSLLKSLASDRDEKTVTWAKQSSALQKLEIPTQFTTTSRLCILCNEFPKVSKNVQAVLDRAKLVCFTPDVEENHEYVRTFWGKENRAHMDVYNFFGENLYRITTPSIRLYNAALREKLLGNNFKEWLLKQWQDDNQLLTVVAEIIKAGIPKGKAREEAWAKKTGMSRPSWYLYQKRYQQSHSAAKRPEGETIRLSDWRSKAIS